MSSSSERKDIFINDVIGWATSRKQHIERDPAFVSSTVTVETDPLLALRQVKLKTEHTALSAILGMWEDAKHD